ncbi:hypothetical protein [Nonomuraea diastatica]|uniref:Uncharacterized protein n=1 Tax=Nonomuraea diastatica TaxID=1848329 RepID=A0A4R4W4H1_9ACTN|nr:hypothetical protein [Nonomuraea diastatica]TDD13458.1 hypothetical protein E1294_40880 [Nonomuraea diastatica]
MPGGPTRRMALVSAVTVAGLLTGCGSVPEETAAPAGAPTTSSTSPAPSSPPATPSPTATPFPKAKNGTKLRACRDAKCEVLVSDGRTITLDARWGLAPVAVSVEDDSVTFHVVTASGMQATMSEQTPDQGGPSTINDVSFEVLAVKGKKAVIKITH